MPTITLVTGNRIERLVEALAEFLCAPTPRPLRPETVVVQSRGMERWVSREVARLNGICANVRFPFPKLFFEEYFRGMPPAPPEADAEPAALTFRLMRLLARHRGSPALEGLGAYLTGEQEPLKRYQLCRVLADLFDQYAVFRPEMLRDWERGRIAADPAHRWQAFLWRELVAEEPALDRARLWRERLAAAAAGARPPDPPERVAFFGISYLPPLYLEAIRAVALTTAVHLFVPNPCREYWAEIVSAGEERAIGRSRPEILQEPERLHLEKGNRLLAAFGAAGRDFFSQLAELEADVVERFEAPEGETLLSRVQRDILELREPESAAAGPACPSIQVHACHSPMREIEVLHDALLDFFVQDPDLTPEEIVVMAPDIGAYAPLVAAVFGAPPDERMRIPYTIADRGPVGGGRIHAALQALLDLKGSRLGAAQVLGLLELPIVRARFGIAAGELDELRRWVTASGVRWGRDEVARAALGLPGDPHHTWRAGIERLLLGYAMPSDGPDLFDGILPLDAVEGRDGRLLGDFIDFLQAVFTLAAELETPRGIADWGRRIGAVLDGFIAPEPDDEAERRMIGALLAELAALESTAGFSEPVPLEIVRSLLAERLDAERIGWGFLSGGVTFCAMLPMRTIPFKIICLIGMHHDAFPRVHHPPDFDLAARSPRRGDRSRRHDDKYLFLESLLAARRTLYISYVGQSIQDNSRRPPSVVVSELLDALRTGYGVRSDPAPEGVVRLHRLQAFSPEYFGRRSALFSYSRDDGAACRAAAEPPFAHRFFDRPLPLSAEEAAAFREVTPERLVEFFRAPAGFLLRHRLGIRLEEAAGPPPEREPFGLEPLAAYRLGAALLEAGRSGGDLDRVIDGFRAAGELPHGAAGEVLSRRLKADVERFLAAAAPYLSEGEGAAVEIDRELAGFHLQGRVAGLAPQGCLSLRYADLTAQDFIGHWIRHLCLCLAAGDAPLGPSRLIGKDAAWDFARVDRPEEILGGLLALYGEGLTRPLPFFPQVSLKYFQAAGTDARKALDRARDDWVGREEAPGPGAAPDMRLLFDEGEALGQEFERLAKAIFTPLFDHGRQIPFSGSGRPAEGRRHRSG